MLDGKGGFTGETEDYIQSRGGDTGAMARYTHTMNGAFEVYKTQSGEHVLRQQTDITETGVGGSWNSGAPVTLIGDFRWTNYKASVDVLFEREDVKNYAAVAIREILIILHLQAVTHSNYIRMVNGNCIVKPKKL